VWQPAPDMLHFCVADVSGKGTPGAMIAAMLYASVSTLSSSSNSPERILGQVETILRDQLGEGHYVTIFYGVLDLRTRVLHYVNAGHCPPIVRHGDGTIDTLAPTRPVLGLRLDAAFRSERLRLVSGDQLLLYTDGVTEAANGEGEEFEAEHLAKAFDGGAGPLPEQWSALMEKVRAHANGNLADDATIVLISVGS